MTDIIDDELARGARDLAADGTEFHVESSDVTDLADCIRVVDRIVERWGRRDVVVRNTVYIPLITFEATTPEERSRQINVVIGGMFNCTRAVWNQMRAQGGGHIIGIVSRSTINGFKQETGCCTVKH